MYAIKMESDKTLITTVKGVIRQHEKNADTLLFLLPKKYEDKNIADCNMMLRYCLPNNVGKSEELEMDPNPYNEDYYLYRLKVGSRFTDVAGDIVLWLTAIDMYDDLVLRTSDLQLEIEPTSEITDFLSDKDMNQLDSLTAQVAELQRTSVDGIIYNSDKQSLQLAADNSPIGNRVELVNFGLDDTLHLDGGGSAGIGDDNTLYLDGGDSSNNK